MIWAKIILLIIVIIRILVGFYAPVPNLDEDEARWIKFSGCLILLILLWFAGALPWSPY